MKRFQKVRLKDGDRAVINLLEVSSLKSESYHSGSAYKVFLRDGRVYSVEPESYAELEKLLLELPLLLEGE